MTKTTIEQLYWQWKRPRSSCEGGVALDYAWGEDSYTFEEYAALYHFTPEEIENLDPVVKHALQSADDNEKDRLQEILFPERFGGK